MAEDLDPKISRRYRELGADEPPRELDQAILAAAHRAADRPHAPLVAPAGRHRWYFALGAAAILVLAVAITVQVERQPDPEALTPSTVSVPPDRADRFYSQAEKESKGQVEPSKPLADAGPPPVRERRKAPPQQTAPAAPPQAPAVEIQNAPAAAPVTPAPPQPDSRDQSRGAAAGLFSRQEDASRSREAAPGADPAPAASPEATARPRANVQESRAVASIPPQLSPEQLLER